MNGRSLREVKRGRRLKTLILRSRKMNNVVGFGSFCFSAFFTSVVVFLSCFSLGYGRDFV